MQLKHHSDIVSDDLDKIEDPFFACQKVRGCFVNPADWIPGTDQILSGLGFDRRHYVSSALLEHVIRLIENGEWFLVHGFSSMPYSPAIETELEGRSLGENTTAFFRANIQGVLNRINSKIAGFAGDGGACGDSNEPSSDRARSESVKSPAIEGEELDGSELQASSATGKTVDELIDSEIDVYNSLNGLEGEAFKNNALIDYHISPDMEVLTKDEYLSLHLYTTDLYKPINNGLRGFSPSDKVKWSKVSADADSALAKLGENPKLRYEGDVSRGDTFSDEFLEKLFPVGGEHQDMAFKSSTSNLGKPFNGNTTTSIKSKSGVRIQNISVVSHEEEVLFRPGTKFKVLSREKHDGHTYIELEEI